MRRTQQTVAFFFCLVLSPSANSQALPDVVGLRPGIRPQEAYEFFKARDPRAVISISQTYIAALANKPIPIYMTFGQVGIEAPEVITVALTMPPSAQQVWGIVRQLQYRDPSQEPLAASVVSGLTQKYGQPWPTGSSSQFYWAFDEKGQPVKETPTTRLANCPGALDLSTGVPLGSRDTAVLEIGEPVTPLRLNADNPCASLVTVLAQLQPGSRRDTLRQITVYVVNSALALRSRQAVDAVMNNLNQSREVQRQKELERRPPPKF